MIYTPTQEDLQYRSAELCFDYISQETREMAVTTVAITKPSKGTASEDVSLPGTVQANIDAPIYARTSGYLKRWLVDIGTRVKAGQLLAEIDTPEVQQQLSQAEAEVANAEANAAAEK